MILAASGLFTCTAYAVTIFVDEDASGDNSGESWTHAFTDLQDALSEASQGDEIWVAEGIYKPSVQFDTSDVRSAAFRMKNEVAIYGGFDPSIGDIAFEDRDWNNNATIASGDIGIEGDKIDNCYHIFYHPDDTNLDSTAILDGLTITSGNANNSTDSHCHGGGMHNSSSSPALTNCIFTNNSAGYKGGGMYNKSSSSPTLTNCTFSSNSAASGSGMYNDDSFPSLTNCTFSDNLARNGGGMYNFQSSPALINCILTNNSTLYDGGGMYNDYSSPSLINCIFTNNSAVYDGGGIYNDKGKYNDYSSYSSPTLINCIFTNNSALYDGGGMYNEVSKTALTNCTFYGNSAANGGGMNNYYSFPTLTNCIMWGDIPDEIYYNDTVSNPTVTYSDIQGEYPGTGNIDQDPLFVNISGLADPANWDLHLQANSPCIDAGDNDAPNLPEFDFEGDDRKIDDPLTNDTGNGVSPIVDMGTDEYTLPCEGDLDGDLDGDRDIDGSDLAILTSDLSQMDLADFALVYGNIGCTGN